jgi:hypothetical protein
MRLLKKAVNGFFGLFGLQLGAKHSPFIAGSPVITGSFPQYADLNKIGARENYFIQDGYRHRAEYSYYDDRTSADEYQDEVYRYAREVADQYGLQSVADVGCGSAYKLMKYFKDKNTIGLDVATTYEALRRRYPDRQWAISNFDDEKPPTADLVIASDVIEHLLYPDQMMTYILRLKPKYVIISTPDRNLIRLGTFNGPPGNPNHIREWSMAELHAYLSTHLEILEHFHSSSAQWTQCVLARPFNS